MLENINEMILGGSRQPTLIGFKNSCRQVTIIINLLANWHFYVLDTYRNDCIEL